MTGESDEQQPGAERARLDTTGEFFSVGAPLHAVRPGYVRRSADDVLYETLLAGRYAHVIAPARSGKSSLVAATAARLEHNGFKVAILDLEQIGDRDAGADAGRWYYSVAYRLLRQLRIRTDLQSWWHDKSILSNRQRLLEFYSEVILQHVQERIVVFVDGVQCVGDLDFADQLLVSIRAAHNARATDPDYSRLTFVLLGECDPLSLQSEAEASPFNITQAVSLDDFSRSDLDLFAAELNLEPAAAAAALDRIYYWTHGQPYLSQKLARAVSRERVEGDVAGHVDRLVGQQLTGRNALHNEPHLSHIHRQVVNDARQRDGLLNLYGRIRKGVHVDTDLGSPLQRRLLALGLLAIDADGNLVPRNRVYAAVFTARWANEHLPNHWRAPALAALAIVAIVALPFWYSQLLPRSYVEILTSESVDLEVAAIAYENFRSFPGHTDAADSLYRNLLAARARMAGDESEIAAVVARVGDLPDAGRLGDELEAGFWDRQARQAAREERRDDALLATLNALVLATPQRRARAAALVGDDYPRLLASLPTGAGGDVVFNPGSVLLTATRGAQVTQWSLANQGLQRREDWAITALEVSPLVRRVIVDRGGQVSRIGLTLNISHARATDLRIKLIAPSGRAVEIDPGVERATLNEDLTIAAAQLGDLVGEPLEGTWSLSVRDEGLGVGGQLVGWKLRLNSQVLVEDFQRGLNVPDPVERETDNIWFGPDGRFAVARATQSDSARIWDLAFAKPVSAVAVSEAEQLIGLSAGARLLVTADQDAVNLWDTATGTLAAALPVGASSTSMTLIAGSDRLLVQRRSETDTHFELWSLQEHALQADIQIAGAPALFATDPGGSRIAVADFDRAVRVWDFASGELVAQFDLRAQPSDLQLAAGGEVVGVVLGDSGATVWRTDTPAQAIVEQAGPGRWQLAFSASGTRALLGRSGHGFRVHDTLDGLQLGPVLDSGRPAPGAGLLGFSADEKILVTAGAGNVARFWQAPAAPARDIRESVGQHTIWPPSGDAVAIASPDARQLVIGDRDGDVHIVPASDTSAALRDEAERVSFLGHGAPVQVLAIDAAGALIASAAADNTVRIWDTHTGLPRSFFGVVIGNPVEQMAFAPGGQLVAVLSSNRVHLLRVDDGMILARFELTEPHRGLAFADANTVYLGSDSGALRVLARGADGSWTQRQVAQGDVAVRSLATSPVANALVLVDQNDRASKLDLVAGRAGVMTLQLPTEVEEVAFAPGGSRVLLRTAGWIHRAAAGATGLIWLDAAPAPQVLNGARIVFGDTANGGAAALANRAYLPITMDGGVRLAELDFTTGRTPGLFGTRDELLAEWRRRLGRDGEVTP